MNDKTIFDWPPLRFFYVLWFLTIFVTCTIVGAIATLIAGLFSRRAARYVTNPLWGFGTMIAAGIHTKYLGRENLPPTKGGYIVYANHTSALDIPALVLATGLSVTWVAKASLGKIPFFGWGLAKGHMLVDRDGGASAAKEMVAEAAVRLEDHQTLAIFPEGTRNRSDQPLLPFKKGAFILAKHSKAPMIPVAIKNAGNLWPVGRLAPRPGTIRCLIGEPIIPQEGESLGALTQRAQTTLEAMLRDEKW